MLETFPCKCQTLCHNKYSQISHEHEIYLGVSSLSFIPVCYLPPWLKVLALVQVKPPSPALCPGMTLPFFFLVDLSLAANPHRLFLGSS